MRLRAAEIAAATGGRLVGPDVPVEGASIDSRDLVPGSLFVPIVDARDGHDFVGAALERGAAAFLTSRPLDQLVGVAVDDVTAIVVTDPAAALLALGRAARARLDGPDRPDRSGQAAGPDPSAAVIGITGSVGKTTTKDLLAGVLATTFRTSASPRSFNNELGVPLTLVNTPDGTQAVVVEMGARGRGHIALLCEVARPTVAVVTTVEMVHTQLFGDLGEVAAAKAELVEALPPDGAAVLNADNVLVSAMADRTAARVLRFSATGATSAGGASGPAPDLWVSDVELDDELRPRFRLHSPWGDADVRLGARGRHNVTNALAAAGAALVAGVPIERVADGLAGAALSALRMDLRTAPSGARILNDSYNAGPASMAAALAALTALGADRSTAVLGVMAELGDDGPAEHRAVAELAAGLGVRVIAVAAPDYGPTVEHAADPQQALARLDGAGELGPGDAVLVKGSRVAGLELLAAALVGEPATEG